ncbi:MAG: NifU N-terminal domain-containing protein [Acidimicrobiia bacterium]
MPVTIEATPNPRAMKFSVGSPVGGPVTVTDAASADEPFASILALDGVASVFATADFVTVTRSVDAEWSGLSKIIAEILDEAFS